MKILLMIIIASLGNAFAADKEYPRPDVFTLIGRHGELTLSDGSSIYSFSKGGGFYSEPTGGMSGRTMEGTWSKDEQGRIVVVAKLGWVNGWGPDGYRRIVIHVGSIYKDVPVHKFKRMGRSYNVFEGYFLIDQMVTIPNPEEPIKPLEYKQERETEIPAINKNG